MGLYLCVFDQEGNEVEGVEVGSYGDFNSFREAVTEVVESGDAGRSCPVLINHSDCDGAWTPVEAHLLLAELDRAEQVMREHPPAELSSSWKKEVAKTMGIAPKTLFESFFDIDGEPLIERLKELAQASVRTSQPILFQ